MGAHVGNDIRISHAEAFYAHRSRDRTSLGGNVLSTVQNNSPNTSLDNDRNCDYWERYAGGHWHGNRDLLTLDESVSDARDVINL